MQPTQSRKNHRTDPPKPLSVPGKVQFGSGWWFLDQKEAMEWQIYNLIGRDVVNGELPRNMKLLGGMVADICFNNARDFFDLELDRSAN